MTNTSKSFCDKWTNNPNAFYDLSKYPEILKWILDRNGWESLDKLKIFLGNKKRILDAGCGNGRITKLLRDHSNPDTEIVAIDYVSIPIAKENLKEYKNIFFYEKNLLDSLKDLGKFDFVYCQEVLHHTGDPKKAFKNLVEILDDCGILAIYVYKKKAPIREFVDDFIRDIMSKMEYSKAFELARKITLLGKSLSEVNSVIKVPEISELGISEGEYTVQRFIYHYFMKCFWNDKASFDENVVVNYDWYHPEDCSRHTVEEVQEWFINNGLKITHRYVDHYGITMHGVKNQR